MATIRSSATKKLILRLDFSTTPKDWRVSNICIDWKGEPLVLFEEGRPPAPTRAGGTDAFLAWANTPPIAHILIHWVNGSANVLRFENQERLTLTRHVQPFGDGWLLGECRDGYTRITDKNGTVLSALDLGDASEHLQTTPDGRIWVGYFDEGVFGNGIGQHGLVCFDSNGEPIFKFMEFAEEHTLPHIADCYALNVFEEKVWVCYYTDFPLVQLTGFGLERVWADFGASRAVAVRENNFVRFPAYSKPYLISRPIDGDAEETVWELEDPSGRNLSVLTGNDTDIAAGYGVVPFNIAARGPRLYVYDERGLYELP